jgi:hypothetical protein
MLWLAGMLSVALADDAPIVVTSVKWKTRAAPVLPLEASLNPVPANVRCRAIATLEPDGKVREVQVDDCKAAFARATRETLRGWTAEPVMHQGKAVRALVPLELEFQTPIASSQVSLDAAGWSEVDWGRSDCSYIHPSAINVGVRTELSLESVGRTGFEGLTCRFLAYVEGGKARSVMFYDCPRELRPAALGVRDQWQWDNVPGCTLVSSVAAYRDLPPLSEVEAQLAPLIPVHASELYVRQRAGFVWPSEEVRAKLLDAYCLVEVTLNTDGTVAKARPTVCPGPLKKAAEAAALQWTWAAPAIDGQAIRAITEIAVVPQ